MQCLRGLFLLTLWALASLAAAAGLEIVTLKYRSAEQVIPVIRPLLAPGGSVSGLQNRLILRTSKANLADLRKVLASLDAMPRRLLITVRQDADDISAQAGADLSVGAGSSAAATGDHAIGTERTGVTARIYASKGATGDHVTQQLQVLEGHPAYIQVGQSIPVPAQTVARTVNGVVFSNSVAYRDLATGFEVVPRVSGARVFLDISPRRETPVGSRGGADMQSVVTSASGNLGEWFELGSSMHEKSRSDSGLLIGGAGLRKDQRRIWVKVEELR